jgi:hypothetical protein
MMQLEPTPRTAGGFLDGQRRQASPRKACSGRPRDRSVPAIERRVLGMRSVCPSGLCASRRILTLPRHRRHHQQDDQDGAGDNQAHRLDPRPRRRHEQPSIWGGALQAGFRVYLLMIVTSAGINDRYLSLGSDISETYNSYLYTVLMANHDPIHLAKIHYSSATKR